MSLGHNHEDMVRHARDFETRNGFTYTILDDQDVIGCVYIYPSDRVGHDAEVSSWVTEARADLDIVVWRTVTAWLRQVWPFSHPHYAARPAAGGTPGATDQA